MTHVTPRRGFTLLELMVYMAVLLIVLTCAWLAYYHCFDHSVGVIRNADDIVRTLQAGELWRKDIRGASARPRLVDGTLHVPQPGGETLYRFADETVVRKRSQDRDWAPFLARVKASRMVLDAGKHVSSWRWEIELKTRRREVRIRPLFTFRAVPAAGR